MAEEEYTSIRISNSTKELLEEARARAPYEEASTTDAFVNYLIDLYTGKKKK